MKKIPTILIVIIFVLLFVQQVFAAEVHLRTRLGFGGYAVPGTLMPVLVEINRNVAAGRLEIISPGEAGSYSIINSLPIQNSKRIEASVFFNESVNGLKIRLISGEQILVEAGLSPKAKLFPGNLILVVKVPASTQHSIEQALQPSEPVLVVPLQAGDLPGNALNYDGVSGLALSDPGPVLTSIQVQALKAWLAGGGWMVLGATRFREDSLLSALGIDLENSERNFYPVGFGGITAFRGAFNDLKQNGSEWQSLLNLRPYTEVTRLMVNRLFPEMKADSSLNSSEQSANAASYLAMTLILWAITGFTIIIPTKRSRMLLLIGFALLWTVIAFPIGSWLAGIWNRGAEIQSRTILLPEVGWMLTDVKVRFNRPNTGKTVNFQSSPWGGTVFVGEDSHGIVKKKNSSGIFIWSQRLSQAKTVAKTAGPGWVNINGWFPFNRIYSGRINEIERAQKFEFDSETVIWNGQHFYRVRGFRDSGNREEIKQIPDWLREENEWLAKLNQFCPDTVWLIGRGHLPDIVIKMENGIFSGELWALPLPEEVQK